MSHSESIGAIAGAIAKVVAACGYVSTDAENSFHRYSYLSDEKLLGHVRGAMSQHGLAIVPMNVEHHTEKVENRKGKTEFLVTTTTTYLLSHTSGEWMHVQVLAMGQDAGDKGPYKAATGALKYALRQVFLIATGDDPEKEREDRRKAELGVDAKGHTQHWRDNHKRYCAQLGDAGLNYNDVAAWCESVNRPRPSAMEPAMVQKVWGLLLDERSDVRQKFNAWKQAQGEA